MLKDPPKPTSYAFTVLFQLVPGLERLALVVHKIAPTVLKLLESHDGHGDPGCMQKPQPLLMLPAPVEIQAGGKEPQADVGMVLDKHSQFLRTAGAGAPRQVAGDFKSLGPVQLQCPDMVNKPDFCMALFRVLKALYVALMWFQLVAQVGLPPVEGPRGPGLVAKLMVEYFSS